MKSIKVEIIWRTVALILINAYTSAEELCDHNQKQRQDPSGEQICCYTTQCSPEEGFHLCHAHNGNDTCSPCPKGKWSGMTIDTSAVEIQIDSCGISICPENAVWTGTDCVCEINHGYVGEDPNNCVYKRCMKGYTLNVNGSCTPCDEMDTSENCVVLTSEKTGVHHVGPETIVAWVLFSLAIIAIMIILIYYLCKRKRRQSKSADTNPKHSSLLPNRRSLQYARKSFSKEATRDSETYSYADTSIIGTSQRDISNSISSSHKTFANCADMQERMKFEREKLRRAIPLPPRFNSGSSREYSFSAPDVAARESVPLLEVSNEHAVNIASPRCSGSQSNPSNINQVSLASWPTIESGSEVMISQEPGYVPVDFNRTCFQATQTGSSLSVESSHRWSTNVENSNSDAEETDVKVYENNSSHRQLMDFIVNSDNQENHDVNSGNIVVEAISATHENEETELLKIVDQSYDENELRLKRTRLLDMHTTDMNCLHAELGSEVVTVAEIHDVNSQHINMERLTRERQDAVGTLRTLQELILKKNDKLKRKEQENSLLQGHIRYLRKENENKDEKLQEINEILNYMMDNFPVDRNSLQLFSADSKDGDLLENPVVTEDNTNNKSIYYTRQKQWKV